MAYCLSLAPLRSASPRGPQQPLSSDCFGLLQRQPAADASRSSACAARRCRGGSEELALVGLELGLCGESASGSRSERGECRLKESCDLHVDFIAAQMRTVQITPLLAVTNKASFKHTSGPLEWRDRHA